MLGEVTAPHSLEPQFRRLGLSTYLVRGVPTLKAPHTVCKAGDTLNANQVQILKLFMKPLATVRRRPLSLSLILLGMVVGADTVFFWGGGCSSRLSRNLVSSSRTGRSAAARWPSPSRRAVGGGSGWVVDCEGLISRNCTCRIPYFQAGPRA